jgi:hypothetical protein
LVTRIHLHTHTYDRQSYVRTTTINQQRLLGQNRYQKEFMNLAVDVVSLQNIYTHTYAYSGFDCYTLLFYDYSAAEDMLPGMDRYRATIYSDGSVHYNFPSYLQSTCVVDVTNFPFDIQRCSLQFGSWSHHGLELDVVNLFNTGNNALDTCAII